MSLTLESLVFLSEQVLHRDLDILKSDIGRATAPDTLAVHASRLDTRHRSLNKQKTDTVHPRTTGTDSRGEVIAVLTIGDPLLLTVDNEVLAIRRLLRLGLQVGNITTTARLRDGKANTLVTIQDAREHSLDDLLLAKSDQRRTADAKATKQVPDDTTAATTR